jgi:hypothetical protein
MAIHREKPIFSRVKLHFQRGVIKQECHLGYMSFQLGDLRGLSFYIRGTDTFFGRITATLASLP